MPVEDAAVRCPVAPADGNGAGLWLFRVDLLIDKCKPANKGCLFFTLENYNSPLKVDYAAKYDDKPRIDLISVHPEMGDFGVLGKLRDPA